MCHVRPCKLELGFWVPLDRRKPLRGGRLWGCCLGVLSGIYGKHYPQIWQFWAPKSAENLVPGRPGTKFSTPALNLVPGTAVHVLDSTKCTNLVLSSTTVQLQYMYMYSCILQLHGCAAVQLYTAVRLYSCAREPYRTKIKK